MRTDTYPARRNTPVSLSPLLIRMIGRVMESIKHIKPRITAVIKANRHIIRAPEPIFSGKISPKSEVLKSYT